MSKKPKPIKWTRTLDFSNDSVIYDTQIDDLSFAVTLYYRGDELTEIDLACLESWTDERGFAQYFELYTHKTKLKQPIAKVENNVAKYQKALLSAVHKKLMRTLSHFPTLCS